MARECPFHFCGKVIDSTLFACRTHWSQMTEEDRKTIWDAYGLYKEKKLGIKQFRELQAAILLHYQAAVKPETKGQVVSVEQLAKEVMVYIAKRKEYTKCKEQMLEQKKKLGMALGHLENALAEKCRSILHPGQTQLHLFDPEEKQKGVPD